MRAATVLLLLITCGAAAAWTRGSSERQFLEAALPNDNRVAAGRLADGVLTLQLEAREALWYPEADSGPAVPLYTFAEVGKVARAPGPMIRVPVGTEVHASVRNALPVPLRLRGLQERAGAALDSIILMPGETRDLRFSADAPGTFYYWGRTESFPEYAGPGITRDAMLLGAFIVDSAGATPRADERVFVLSAWSDTDAALGIKSEAADRVLRREMIPRERWFVTAINGRSWPHTERLSHTVGDTVHWRVINGSLYPHPMHLHGSYFDVEANGDAARDTVFDASRRRLAVTEWLYPGATTALRWVPERAGNWLFHCHIVMHISDATRLGHAAHGSASATHTSHAESGMAGMVLGIQVAPGSVTSGTPEPRPRRRLRLFVTERANVYGDRPGYSYVLQEGSVPPAPDSIRRPASTIVLRRNEPTEITVLNTTTQPATIHWHGLELESFYDGVGDWSGWGSRVAPPVAPGDSFVVRLTPPRAGTFIYHTHTDEGIQLASGMFGALLVLPENASADTTERLVLIGMGGPHDDGRPVVNGAESPPPMPIRRGVAHRFRLINISPLESHTVQLVSGDSVQQWRVLAKDGADLPAAQATARPGTVSLHPGETYDVEVRWERPEPLTLRVLATETIANRAAFRARARPGDRPPRIIIDMPLLFPAPAPTPHEVPVALPNDNRVPAGSMVDAVLTIALEAKLAMWHPDGDSLPGLAVEAFGEIGASPSAPGPLLRVVQGTELHISFRNALEHDTLTFYVPAKLTGAETGSALDSIVVPPAQTGELRVRAERAGNYIYHANGRSALDRVLRMRGLLAGALIVDSAGSTGPPRDRVLVLLDAVDSLTAAGLPDTRREILAINGRSWPHTERLEATVGDTVAWRVLNASPSVHPMHLHGFYYSVDDFDGPVALQPSQLQSGRMVVTERMTPFTTMSMTWVPERPGNWLFHCHFQPHAAPHRPLGATSQPRGEPAPHANHVNHALRDMGGLLMGVHVRPRGGETTAPEAEPRRRLRLVAVSDAGFPDSLPSLRFELEEPASGRRLAARPGFSPTIELLRGEPVSITVVNQLTEPTSVHWHGIELESYFDGVAGFAGSGQRLAPLIAPGDSFEARFTPPRSGTFIYHSHVDEQRQHRAGLVGALIVRDPASVNADDEHLFFIKSYRGTMESSPMDINGDVDPDTVVLQVGRKYRLRFIGLSVTSPNAFVLLTARPDSSLANTRDTMLVQWRPLARDGADLPARERTLRLARQVVSIGETYDFEFEPQQRGELRIEVRPASAGRLFARVPVRVE